LASTSVGPLEQNIGNLEPNTVSAYRIGGDGSLTSLSASPFALGGNTIKAAPNGKVLFSFGLNVDTLELNTDRVAPDGSLKMSSSIADNTLAGVQAISPKGSDNWKDPHQTSRGDSSGGWYS
jgi:hypothetical protein